VPFANAEEEKAVSIVRRLREAGHTAYFAGGCVRDRLAGFPPKDWDIATSAHPEEVQKLFRRTIAVGKQFGVIIVVVGDSRFDVATFRSDGAYVDGRRPETVTYSTAKEDVERRDFTINGLLYDPIDERVIDYVGGVADLEKKVLRTIGTAEHRFTEDRLRLLRAIRFAARFDLEFAPETAEALRRMSPHAAHPSAERILEELEKMFVGPRPATALSLLDEYGLLDAVLPEVSAKKDRLAVGPLDDGRPNISLFRRSSDAMAEYEVGGRDASIAWAILLGDLSDESPGRRAECAVAVLRRLKASSDRMKDVGCLVKSRDRCLFATKMTRARRVILTRHDRADRLARFVAIEREFSSGASHPTAFDDIGRELPPPLLTGQDLFSSGVPKGPAMGRIMRQIRYRQLSGDLADAEAARRFVASRHAPVSNLDVSPEDST
jgi:tRNA nucleotidyltransferase/poly(A) polymerase